MNRTDLYNLGFSEKEAEVYLALNAYGPSPASTLARATKIKRTSVYDTLSSLIARNLIISFRQGAYTYFVIDDVSKLLYQEREKTRIAERVVNDLKTGSLNHAGVQVSYFVGEEGYRELYEDVLRSQPKELMVWIHLDEFYRALDPVREAEWTKERIQKKIYTRLLMEYTPLGRAFQKDDPHSCRQTLLLPKKYFFQSNCFLFDGNIAFFDARDKITGIRIRHQRIFELQKQIFEMNWKLFDK
jgi:sugar-specific transcriptional regulator TrmB